MTKKIIPYFFLLPALLVFSLFVFYPALKVLQLSFQRYSFIASPEWIGFENYVQLLKDSTFTYALMNSLLFLLVTPALIIISLAVAFLLDSKVKGVKLFRALYFLPVITPIIVIGIIWRWLFNEDFGLLNFILMKIGLTDHKIHWLSSYPLNLFSVMFITVWKGIGYYSVIFLAGLMNFPKEIEEAAEIDGAGKLQTILFVKLPMLKPVIVLVAIISSIAALQVFDEIYVVISGAPSAEKTLVPFIYKTAFIDFRLGYASTASIILFLFTLVFSYFNIKMWDKE